jgi:hypothetical protein
LDLGGIDVVLLLVSADLELLQHEILGNLGRLISETGYWIGRDGSGRHDHRCDDRRYEIQARRSRPDPGEPLHSPSETWLRRRALLCAGHDWRTFNRFGAVSAT